jgi:uncharacterized membrane protein
MTPLPIQHVVPKAEALRQALQEEDTKSLRLRRGVIISSLVGAASMTAVTLLQTGVVRHLPDPPIRSFDSDRVNSSDTAYRLPVPDGPISLATFAANIPLAAFGAGDRSRKWPLLPIAIAVTAGIEAVAAASYFYQMPAREKAWCGYCIIGALASFAVFGLTIPEARQAVALLRHR